MEDRPVVKVRLRDLATTRIGWAATALVCGGFAAAGLWVAFSFDVHPVGQVLSLALALLYGWSADGALRLAAARPPRLLLTADAVVIDHPPALNAPLNLPFGVVESATVDARPLGERRIAAGTRRGGIAPAGFVDASLPVLSTAPSAHWPNGTAAAPNLVLWFTEPVLAAAPTRSVRFLLRLSGGRNARYQGPRPGQPFEAIRLVVDERDVPELAEALADRKLLVEAARDRTYLAPLSDRNRRRFRRERVILAGVVSGVLVVLLAVELAAG